MSNLFEAGSELGTVLSLFEQISQVPRGSGKEMRIAEFVCDFATSLGLESDTDPVGNIVIRKPASQSMTSAPVVALQCHMDMVQQQAAGKGFDFDNDPIELIHEGDWLRANGTTLGADNGIGMALAMTVLASNQLAHPPLEVLFTVDEEVGMSGALGVTPDQLKAPYLINLDMESDDALTIGCAGAVDMIANTSYQQIALTDNQCCYQISVSGGKGGHSGLDIHLGRMNAIKVLAQAITHLSTVMPLTLVELSGGEAANVIPQQAQARFVVAKEDIVKLTSLLATLDDLICSYKSHEPNVQISCVVQEDLPETGLGLESQQILLNALINIPSEVISMSPDVPDLVETSNNLSQVHITRGEAEVVCLARSCVESHKLQVFAAIETAFSPSGVSIRLENDAPGWAPVADSPLLGVMKAAYKKVTHSAPRVIAIHAGLETGILSNTFPAMQMVSYGPNILAAHTPEERLQLSSVEKVWSVLTEALAIIPQ